MYTAIIGKYDYLKEPKIVSEGFDYICFTDDVTLKSKVWKIRLVNNNQGLDYSRLSKKIKILCTTFLKEYDLSIWIDGSISINCDLNIFLDKNYHGEDLVIMTHPERNCVYEEAKACIRIKKDNPTIINKQIEGYRQEGYPEGNGMVHACIMIRNHQSKNINEFMDRWWNEVYTKSKRDQLSFNYILWKHKLSINYCDSGKFLTVDFKWHSSHPLEK